MNPTESQHQAAVVQYCRLRGWPFWNTDQAVRIKNPAVRGIRARAGVRAGLPDLVVFVTNGGRAELAFVEMKRERGPKGGLNGSKIGPGQIQFGDLCAQADILHRFCHGADEAIQFLNAVHAGM